MGGVKGIISVHMMAYTILAQDAHRSVKTSVRHCVGIELEDCSADIRMSQKVFKGILEHTRGRGLCTRRLSAVVLQRRRVRAV